MSVAKVEYKIIHLIHGHDSNYFCFVYIVFQIWPSKKENFT
jgi:hypothetical protein